MSARIFAGIYVLRNTANGRVYVGSAMNVPKRWREHRTELYKGTTELIFHWRASAATSFKRRKMATTAHDLIRGAMRLIGAVDPGEELTADEAADGLELLNEMLESLSNEGLACYQTLQENFALSSGVASYTVGSGATFNTTRPLDVLSAFIRDGGIDYPLRILNREEYDRIQAKTTQYQPEYLMYTPSVANGVITLYGVPAKAYAVTDGLYINSMKQLQQFTGLTTAIVLPPGYKRMLRYNLAPEIAPEYGRKVPDAVLAIAREAKANIKRTNARTPKLRLKLGLWGNTSSDMAAFTAGYQ